MKAICNALGLLAVSLLGLDAGADDAQNDLKALQGTWNLVYFERDGKEVKLSSDTQSIITGNSFVVKVGDKIIASGNFTIDPSKKPKASTTTYIAGLDQGKTFPGIYQLEGDTTKFARAGGPDQPRPTEFKTQPDSGQFVSVYRRAKR